MQKQATGTLADKIAGILNTAPSSFNPEENAVDATDAQISFEHIEDTNNEEEEILSKFRQQNVELLADVDEKYAGRKASRRSLRESSEEEESDEAPPDSDDDIEESEEEIDDSSDISGESGVESSENEEVDDSTNFKHINDTNVSNQIKKGVCVRNQMTMWENLLEIRIQLQKCLLAANKMPTSTKLNNVKTESGVEFSNKITETKTTLCSTLDKLLTLQKLCLKQYPETKNLDKENGEISNNEDHEDDEEIPSDTDAELSEQEETVEIKTPKKRRLEEYETDINSRHKKYKDYRNKTIQKWNDKTRVILKGGATSHSVLDQIEYNLSNKDKLIKKTQQKRSQYTIIGEDAECEYYPEIFDDDDFYHQLLRELIEVKSADVTDPVQLGRQWIQLQSLRSKMKRKIDTRATKGRKIRYAVHNKLVNFMAPIDEELWTDEAKTELYGSLFGKNQAVFNV